MNNSGEQNGRQPAPEQAAPPSDPRIRSLPTVEGQRICRDYVWGICLMNEHCKYRHELEFDSMKAILKFCHDYQNRTGCARPDCTYLHTSREEENLFLTTGQIPRVLAERYAVMSSLPVSSAPENAPPMLYMNEYLSQPPPPPPLPAAGVAPPPPPVPMPLIQTTSMPVPVPCSMSGPMPGNMTAPMSSNMPGAMSASMHGNMSAQMPSNIATQIPNNMSTLMPANMSGPMQVNMTSMPGAMSAPISGAMSAPMCGPMSTTMPGPMSAPMPGSMSGPMPGSMSGPMPGSMSAPMPTSMQGPIHTPMQGPMPSILAPPPPPPPPPTAPTASTQLTGQVYTAPPPVQQTTPVMFPVTQPPPVMLPMYDPTRPPPPFSTNTQNRGAKRPAPDASEPGPSKARKSDVPCDSLCENCVQRELRIEFYRHENERLQREEDAQRVAYEKKSEEFENGLLLLRSVLSPDVYRIINEYIETNGATSSNDLFGPSSSSQSYSDTSTVPRSFLLQLMEYILTSSRTSEHVPLLETITRRQTQQSPDVLASFLDLIRNTNALDNRVATADMNGVSRFTNGQDSALSPPSGAPVAPRYSSPHPAPVSPRYTVPPQPVRQYPVEPTNIPPNPPHTAAAPVGYMPYPPAVPPPPNRAFYGQPYPTAVANNINYTNPGVAAPQSPRAASSTPPAAVVNGQSYPQYMTRLPQQYYPPFQ